MFVRTERTIAAPFDRTWARLADLEALAEWSPTIAESPADPLRPGAVRRAVLKEPSYGKETLVERVLSVGDGSFTYEIEGGIGPLVPIVTTWRLVPEGAGSRLTVESDLGVQGAYRLMAPLVRMAWRKQLRALADAFARDVEARA